MDDRFEKVDGFLFLNLGFTAKHNAWAGPDHWKYRKAKGKLYILQIIFSLKGEEKWQRHSKGMTLRSLVPNPVSLFVLVKKCMLSQADDR